MEEEFLKLKTFFENLGKDEAVDYFENMPFIRTEWLYSQSIDRRIIKEAIAEIMLEKNPKYSKFAPQKKTVLTDPETRETHEIYRDIYDIQGFKIIIQDKDHGGRLLLQAVGADDYTKLNISNVEIPRDNQSENQILLITLDKFAKIIADKLTKMQLAEKLKVLKLDIKTEEQFKKAFLNDERRLLENLETARRGLKELFENAVKYYRYLIEYKNFGNEETTYIIEQRKDEKDKECTQGRGSKPRVNEIIDFVDRADILKRIAPAHIRTFGERIEGKEEIIVSSYTVFVYTKLQENNIGGKIEGWLFVCEPQRGDRATRLMYLTKEEFEKFDIETNSDRIAVIAKHYLDMSQSEFDEAKSTLTLRHTSMEGFSQKMKFYITGEKPTKGDIKGYIGYGEKLYNQDLMPNGYKPKPRKTKGEISKIVEGVPESQVDKTAQEAIDNSKEETRINE